MIAHRIFLNVGVSRLELPTPCTPCKYASQLRHTPFILRLQKYKNFHSLQPLFKKNLFFVDKLF